MFLIRIEWFTGWGVGSMHKRLCVACCLVTFLFAAKSMGAELVFKNGDRLKGTIVEVGPDTVRFQSESVGEVLVPLEKVDLKRDAAETPLTATGNTAPSQPADSPEPVLMEKEDESRRIQDLALERWTALWEKNAFWAFLERYYPLKNWKNRLDFGFFFENSARKDVRYDFAFSTEKRSENHETKFNIAYAHRRIDDVANRDQTRGSLLYRYDFAESFFVQSNTRYQRRPLETVSQEFSESLGLGYRWLDEETIRGTLTPEVGVNYANIGGSADSWVFLGSMVQDLEIDISQTLKVTEDLVLQYSPSEAGDFVLNFQTGLENRITKSLSLRVVYDYIYDERVANEDRRTRETIRVTFGARF